MLPGHLQNQRRLGFPWNKSEVEVHTLKITSMFLDTEQRAESINALQNNKLEIENLKILPVHSLMAVLI